MNTPHIKLLFNSELSTIKLAELVQLYIPTEAQP